MELHIYDRQETYFDRQNADAKICKNLLIVNEPVSDLHLAGHRVIYARIDGVKHHIYLESVSTITTFKIL